MLSVPVPSVVVPLVKVTVPVGVPMPETTGVTVAVKVTDRPEVEVERARRGGGLIDRLDQVAAAGAEGGGGRVGGVDRVLAHRQRRCQGRGAEGGHSAGVQRARAQLQTS